MVSFSSSSPIMQNGIVFVGGFAGGVIYHRYAAAKLYKLVKKVLVGIKVSAIKIINPKKGKQVAMCAAMAGRRKQWESHFPILDKDCTDPRVLHKTWTFEGTGETMPYALVVPSTYKKGTPTPLLVMLHGGMNKYDNLLVGDGVMDAIEKSGAIAVCPMGYHRTAFFGSRYQTMRGDPVGPVAELAEQCVMEAIAIVLAEYTIDKDRISITGFSMGGAGSVHFAFAYPQMFAAIGGVAPGLNVPKSLGMDYGWTKQSVEKLDDVKHLPFQLVFGAKDPFVKEPQGRHWEKAMHEKGMDMELIVMPEHEHMPGTAGIWHNNVECITKHIEFLVSKRRGRTA